MGGLFRLLTPDLGARFDFRRTQPPGGQFVEQDDVLLVTVQQNQPSAVAEVRARLLEEDGVVHVFRYTIGASSSYTPTVFSFPLARGFLLSVEVVTTVSGLRRGQAWVRVEIAKGSGAIAVPVQLLIAGYLETGSALAWPPTLAQVMAQSPGFPAAMVESNPPAGGGLTVTVPSFLQWRLICWRGQLTTSSVSATRQVTLKLHDSLGNEKAVSVPNATQGPSSTQTYVWGVGAPDTAALAAVVLSYWPPDLLLLPGDQLILAIGTVQAADQLASITITVEQLLIGP